MGMIIVLLGAMRFVLFLYPLVSSPVRRLKIVGALKPLTDSHLIKSVLFYGTFGYPEDRNRDISCLRKLPNEFSPSKREASRSLQE